MFLLFDARCVRCGNHFKAEADAGASPTRESEYRYTCPRCYTPGTAAAGDGAEHRAPTPWAVRAAPARTNPPRAG